ncbi:MAG: hypothetical protein Tp178MES00d2C33159851_62 [Prokaryotic dsDNA virus sp.]|nr:MAG: hypothetical protein Tp178MES00d2C33159851_62 [Prokaryotic dsDNA virus sp.]|tara:strand:- start:65822 stop:66013 length:192 start_codon:yes stop_codon:yes gene_type:complete
MKTKNPPHMWSYWEEKKGFHEALEGYYRELFSDPDIREAYRAIKMNEDFIRQKIKGMEGDDDE